MQWECREKIPPPDGFEGGESQDLFANEGRIRGKEKIQRDCHISRVGSWAVSSIELAKKNESKSAITASLTSSKKRKIHLTFSYCEIGMVITVLRFITLLCGLNLNCPGQVRTHDHLIYQKSDKTAKASLKNPFLSCVTMLLITWCVCVCVVNL